jgi:hypothetical protein
MAHFNSQGLCQRGVGGKSRIRKHHIRSRFRRKEEQNQQRLGSPGHHLHFASVHSLHPGDGGAQFRTARGRGVRHGCIEQPFQLGLT